MEKEEIRETGIERVLINPAQPRRQFSDEDLQELADTIKAVGILHPPLVRPLQNGDYELISGERRLRAAKLAGLKKITVVVREASALFSAEAALIENIQRADLNPIEIAKALKSLMESLGINQEALSLRIGKKRSTIANYVRLLSLPSHIQHRIMSGEITMGHAKIILSLDNESKQNILLQRIIDENLTVKESEIKAQALMKKQTVTKPFVKNLHFVHLTEQMEKIFGTKVSFKGKGKRGKMVIDYYSLDDLDRIVTLIGLET